MNKTTHSGILSIKELKEAVDKIKKIDPPSHIRTGSMQPIEKLFPRANPTVVGSIFGLQVITDETLAPNEYKVIYASGKEEKHEWK